ncbi:MAG: hypothetical protein JXO44_07880, partial [Clostridia bacterium]|nr:hypothetical protein [Clostridia bacterium]
GQGTGDGRGTGTSTKEGEGLDFRILENAGNFQMVQYGEKDSKALEVLSSEADFGEKLDAQSVMAIYEKQALRDLSDQEIPVGMETFIKDYFTKINQ